MIRLAADADADVNRSVDYRPGPDTRWQTAETPVVRRVVVGGIGTHRVHRVPLSGLEAGVTFAYRVSRNGRAVFESEARAPRVASQRQWFVE